MCKKYYLMKNGKRIESINSTYNIDMYISNGYLILNVIPLDKKYNLGKVVKVDYDYKSLKEEKKKVTDNREDLETMLYLFYSMID